MFLGYRLGGLDKDVNKWLLGQILNKCDEQAGWKSNMNKLDEKVYEQTVEESGGTKR